MIRTGALLSVLALLLAACGDGEPQVAEKPAAPAVGHDILLQGEWHMDTGEPDIWVFDKGSFGAFKDKVKPEDKPTPDGYALYDSCPHKSGKADPNGSFLFLNRQKACYEIRALSENRGRLELMAAPADYPLIERTVLRMAKGENPDWSPKVTVLHPATGRGDLSLPPEITLEDYALAPDTMETQKKLGGKVVGSDKAFFSHVQGDMGLYLNLSPEPFGPQVFVAEELGARMAPGGDMEALAPCGAEEAKTAGCWIRFRGEVVVQQSRDWDGNDEALRSLVINKAEVLNLMPKAELKTWADKNLDIETQ